MILHHELGTVAEETGENELFTSTLVQVRNYLCFSATWIHVWDTDVVLYLGAVWRPWRRFRHGHDGRNGAFPNPPSYPCVFHVDLESPTPCHPSSPSQPIALGALLILDGLITSRGLVSPSSPEVWEPLLVSLESRGVKMVERRKKGTRGVLGTLERDVDAWKVAGKM